MFQVQTCPTCDGLLGPGRSRCAACTRPDPETADPWRSGTPEAVAAPAAPATPPAPGSLLAVGPSRARRSARRSRWITAVAALAVATALTSLLWEGGWLAPGVEPVFELLGLGGR